MKIICCFIICFCCTSAFAQTTKPSPQKIKLDTENMIVKDSSGTIYSKTIWQKLLMTGRYNLKAVTPGDKTNFVLVRLTDEEYEKRKQNLPKPKESTAFKTGSKFLALVGRDIDGEKINTKKMKGQILVINFWFTTCGPCIQEMPELNELTEQYKNDSTISFIAVGLESESEIKDFLEMHPFKYRIMAGGKNIVPLYAVKSYPTHVVVAPDGKVYFHTSGYGMSTVHWIKKSIEALKAAEQGKGLEAVEIK